MLFGSKLVQYMFHLELVFHNTPISVTLYSSSEVEIWAANSRLGREILYPTCLTWWETLTFRWNVELEFGKHSPFRWNVKVFKTSHSNLGSWGFWYPSNFCIGVICCIHHSHSGHEVGCTTAWQLECIHVDCSHWNSPCLPSTNLMWPNGVKLSPCVTA